MQDSTRLQHYRKWVGDIFAKVADASLDDLKNYLDSLAPRLGQAQGDPFLAEYDSVSAILQSLKEGKGKRCLHFAAARGDPKLFAYLVEQHRCDPGAADEEGNDSFFTAVQHRHKAIVEYLLAADKKLVERKRDGVTGLFLAAMNGDCEMARLLLDHGASLQSENNYGRPINAASAYRHKEMVQLLLERGAAPEGCQGGEMPAPLLMAIDYCQVEIVKLLLKHRHRVDVKDPNGMPALHVAAEKPEALQILKLLVEAGADCEQQYQGRTALQFAFFKGNFDSVSFLRQKTRKQELVFEKEEKVVALPEDPALALKFKEKGNEEFKRERYNEAIDLYKEGLKHMQNNAVLLGNLSASYFKLGDFKSALKFGQLSKAADPGYKGAFREAEAYWRLGEFGQAAASYWEALKLDPSNSYMRQQFNEMVRRGRAK